jgi:(p)ppGpp synthase/HD superfamily hydrolase
MKHHISSIAQKKGIKLSEEKLIEITINALDVKFADRIHNLTTQWDPNNLEQVKKKLEETKKYFYKIAQEINITAFNKMKKAILTLEIKLN